FVIVFFFFQAEDGIRDRTVTGVQTCALPISGNGLFTIAIRRLGWRISYDEEAIAWTEAPETAGQLIRQRFRWTFGTLQSFWKHEIGRASCRERVESLGVDGVGKEKRSGKCCR